MIYFASEDRDRSGDMSGWTDQDGCFACEPIWWTDHTGRTRYRIVVNPDPRRDRRNSRPSESEVSLQAAGIAAVHPERGKTPSPDPIVVPASVGSPSPIPPVRSPRSEEQPLSQDPVPVAEVSIGSGPVQIDIDLRD
jgi:hypothetical protein